MVTIKIRMERMLGILLVCTLIFSGCKSEDNQKPKKGVGMFENTSSLLITYNDSEYEITDKKIVNEFSAMCGEKFWKNSKSKIIEEQCELTIVFKNARATLYIQLDEKVGLLQGAPITIDDDIVKYIKDYIIDK